MDVILKKYIGNLDELKNFLIANGFANVKSDTQYVYKRTYTIHNQNFDILVLLPDNTSKTISVQFKNYHGHTPMNNVFDTVNVIDTINVLEIILSYLNIISITIKEETNDTKK